MADEDTNYIFLGLFGCTGFCCFVPMMICLLGAAVTFHGGCYRGGDFGDANFIVFANTEPGLTAFSFVPHDFVELGADTFGVDLGKVDAGSVTAASVSGQGGTVVDTEAAASGANANVKEVEHEDKQFMSASNVCYIDDAEYTSESFESYKRECKANGRIPVDRMQGLGYQVISMVICMLIVKGYKYFLLFAMINPGIDDKMPTKLYELFVNNSHGCFGKAINLFWLPVDFVLLTWAPNLLILPLSSIQAKENYYNAGQLKYCENANMLSYGFFVGVVCFIVLFSADTYNGKEKTEKSCVRIPLLIMRGVLLVMVAGILLIAFTQIVVSIYVAFGIEFSAIFNWSFRYGLLTWTTFLRFFSSCMVLFELPLTIILTCGVTTSAIETSATNSA